MGTILSPTNGQQVYKGQQIAVTYRSDTVDFSCGSLSRICTVVYKVDGVNVSGNVPISQTGIAPQTQSPYNITIPLVGATTQIDVEGWGVGGSQRRRRNDTSTTTVNLVDVPTVSCGSALVTDTTAQLQGNIGGTLIPGGSIRFKYGTAVGGPYLTIIAATPYAVGGVTANIIGLAPSTAYYFVCEVLDVDGNSVVASSECSFTTQATVTNEPSEAQLVKLCTITGTNLLKDCTTNNPVLLVTVTSSDGDIIPTDSTEFVAGTGAGIFSIIGFYRSYYTDLTGNYLVPQPTNVCSPSPSNAAVQTIIEGYNVNVASNGTQTVTFATPVQTLSLGNIGNNILKLTITTNPVAAGNLFQYVMPGGTISLDAGTGYTFTSLTIDNLGSGQSTILVNGVTPGNV